MRGVPVPGFASFLGSVGLVSSLKIILDAVNLLVLEPESEDRPKTIFSLFAVEYLVKTNILQVDLVKTTFGKYACLLKVVELSFCTEDDDVA